MLWEVPLVDIKKGQMKFQLNNEEVTFNICRSMRKSGEFQSLSAILYNIGETSEIAIEELLGVEALAAVIINFYNDCIKSFSH